MDPEITGEALPEEDAVKPKSFFARLGGVYSSPGNTFREIGLSPDVLWPIIALLLINMLIGFYMSRTLDMESMMASQMQDAVQQGRMTQEQAEQQLAMLSRFAGIQLIAGAPISVLFYVLIVAVYAKIFTVFVAAENRFKQLFSVTAYTMIATGIVHSALLILVLQLKGAGEVTDPFQISTAVTSSLGSILSSFMGEDALPKLVLGILNAVDVFAIWTIALLAIGYSAVSRMLKTATAAVWLGVAWIIIAIILAYAGSLFSAGSM